MEEREVVEVPPCRRLPVAIVEHGEVDCALPRCELHQIDLEDQERRMTCFGIDLVLPIPIQRDRSPSSNDSIRLPEEVVAC